MKPAPLLFEPILKPKVWGGRALERLGKALPHGEPIGESWELADLGSTSVDGGGGDAAHSRVAAGPMRGITLADAINAMGTNLMGDLRLSEDGGFPLLVKFLDARTNLSVQVHPSPEYAAAHPEAHLKTESWYIVDAEPDAMLYIGLKEGVTHEHLRRAISEGTVADLMIRVPAIPGECHTLPSGTVHALGGGVLVAEIQTPSDTTFRVFDWGRTGRTLHVEQALECASLGPLDPQWTRRVTAQDALLARTDFYEIESMRWRDPTSVAFESARPTVLVFLEGSCTLETDDAEPIECSAGDTVLLPAVINAVTIDPKQADAVRALVVEFPAG